MKSLIITDIKKTEIELIFVRALLLGFSNGFYLKTSMKGTTYPEGSACNSCNSWPLYACWADQQARFG